jgi:ATP-dependent DNA ligase
MLASLFGPTKYQQIQSKNMVMETKFDGERIMIHKKGDKIFYFTRNSNDFTDHYSSLDSLISKNIEAENFIIDGEMVNHFN